MKKITNIIIGFIITKMMVCKINILSIEKIDKLQLKIDATTGKTNTVFNAAFNMNIKICKIST